MKNILLVHSSPRGSESYSQRVTGNQGGAVAETLQGSGFRLRGLTREPGSERAVALARNGIDVVKGDLDDEATLRRALAGAWGVFGVENTLEAGTEGEEVQGKRLAGKATAFGTGRLHHYMELQNRFFKFQKYG
jgi:uncharacterized protein YbjT (DUF2867 family)